MLVLNSCISWYFKYKLLLIKSLNSMFRRKIKREGKLLGYLDSLAYSFYSEIY